MASVTQLENCLCKPFACLPRARRRYVYSNLSDALVVMNNSYLIENNYLFDLPALILISEKFLFAVARRQSLVE